MARRARAFAPATVANLGAGFDILGLAVEGAGDTVSVSVLPGMTGIHIDEISGDDGRLPLDASENSAAIAIESTLKLIGVQAQVRIKLRKGLGIGTGLGSSAASAAAGAYAVNLAFGKPLRTSQLIGPCIDAEARVSGRHADNVAPALMGGLVLVRSVEPLDVVRLPIPEGLYLAIVSPEMELETKLARAIVPPTVPMVDAIGQSADLGAFVAACYSDDYALLGRTLNDRFAAPHRVNLIPGADVALKNARELGALGASLSGSGPSVFALAHSEVVARRCSEGMVDAFDKVGIKSAILISPMDCPGVRAI